MNIDDIMIVVFSCQVVGSLFGGGNILLLWGIYIILVFIVCRFIFGGVLVIGLLCVVVVFWGYFMDLVVWLLVLCVVLIVGVFLLLMEVGMQMICEGKIIQLVVLVVIFLVLVNLVFGWLFIMLLDNLGLVGCKDRVGDFGKVGCWIILGIIFLVLCIVMVFIGMFLGVFVIMEIFRF